jgi:hypothetical protein
VAALELPPAPGSLRHRLINQTAAFASDCTCGGSNYGLVALCLGFAHSLALTHAYQSKTMQRQVVQIRAETGTLDEAYSEKLTAHGLELDSPKLYESKRRLCVTQDEQQRAPR